MFPFSVTSAIGNERYKVHVGVRYAEIRVVNTEWNCIPDFIIGTSAKLRKETISFIVSVCPSVRTEQLRLALDEFS